MKSSPDKQRDWAGGTKSFVLAWGLPIAALIGAIFVAHPLKTIIWMSALSWMGLACLMNARRCGRRHCFYTGPFFLIMAVVSGLHGFEIVSLGPSGWSWIGAITGIGSGLLWCLPEFIWGKYVGE